MFFFFEYLHFNIKVREFNFTIQMCGATILLKLDLSIISFDGKLFYFAF